jgi:hypothetical protein
MLGLMPQTVPEQLMEINKLSLKINQYDATFLRFLAYTWLSAFQNYCTKIYIFDII